MSKALLGTLFPNGPYFGGNTRGIQGDAINRHPWMTSAVAQFGSLDRRLRILEIGSFAGFSTLTWAEAITAFCPKGGDILCVDPMIAYVDDEAERKEMSAKGHERGVVNRAELDIFFDNIYDLFRHNTTFIDRAKVSIQHLRAEAQIGVSFLADGLFDIVYVDGSHVYQHVKNDLEAGARVVRDGGLLCGDDLEFQLHEVDADHARRNIEHSVCTDPKLGKSYHCGVTVAVQEFFGEVSNYYGFFAMRRTGKTFEKIDLTRGPFAVPRHFPPQWQEALKELLKAGPIK